VTSNLPIWTIVWIPTIPSFKPSPKFPYNRNFPLALILDFIIPGTKQWNLLALNSVFDVTLAREISNICKSLEPKTKFIWTFSSIGQFTTNLAYLAILNNNNATPTLHISSSFWNDIWKLNLNDRLRLFIWKIVWNILPTRERLNSIFLSSDNVDQFPYVK
jgi:hypothetical protein